MEDDKAKHGDPNRRNVQRSDDEENVPADSDLTASNLPTAGNRITPTNTQEVDQESSGKEIVPISRDPIELVVKYYNVPTANYDAVQLNLREDYESHSEPEDKNVELSNTKPTTKSDVLGSPEETSTLSAKNENTSEVSSSLNPETISSEAVHLNVPVTEETKRVSKKPVGNEEQSSSEINEEILPNSELRAELPLQVTSNETVQSTFGPDYEIAGPSGLRITRIDESSSSSTSNGASVVVSPLSPRIGMLQTLNSTVMKLCRIGRLIQLYSNDTLRINFNQDLTRINTIIDCYSTVLFSNPNMQSGSSDSLISQKSSVQKYHQNLEIQNIPQQSRCDNLKLPRVLLSQSNTKIRHVEPRYPDLSAFPSNINIPRQRLEGMARYKSDSALIKKTKNSNLRDTKSLPNEIFVRRDRRSYPVQRTYYLNYYDGSSYERALTSRKQKYLDNVDYQNYRRLRDFMIGRYENRAHNPAPWSSAMYLPDNVRSSEITSRMEESSVPMSSHASLTRRAERLTRSDMELQGENVPMKRKSLDMDKRKDSDKVDYASDDDVSLPLDNEPPALEPIFLDLPDTPSPTYGYLDYEEQNKVSCPICWDLFPYSEINEHAAACVAYVEEEGACGGP